MVQVRTNTCKTIPLGDFNIKPIEFGAFECLFVVIESDREAAIQNYRKSLALNPDNTNAVDRLKKLRADSKQPNN